MRFASHRDVARAIERGVRKAGIPVAYSAGFSPHPRISYLGGAPTGSASEAEYLELAVTRRCEPDDAGRRLDAALPDGIDVVEVVEVDGKSAALALEASEWEVSWPGVRVDAAASAVRALLAQPRYEVQRFTTKGTKTVDVRAGVLSLTCSAGPRVAGADGPWRAGSAPAAGCAILRMIVRQMVPAVRPDDVLAALCQLSALEPGSPAVATRLWQGPISELSAAQTGDTGMIADREAAGPGCRQRSSGAAGARQPSAGRTSAPRQVRRTSAEEASGDSGGSSPQAITHLSGCTTDKAMRLEAESAPRAPASQARANEQLPRGAGGQFAGPRAREPYGRDCPDARNGATQQQTVRAH